MSWILPNDENTCFLVRKHRERLKVILAREDIYFDEEAAEDVVRFIESRIQLYEGRFANKPFILSEFQKYDVIYPVFGFKWKHNGLRVVKELYLSMARKGGKTPLAVSMLTYLFFKSGSASQFVFAAPTAKQARIGFSDFAQYIKGTKLLEDRVSFRGKNPVNVVTNKSNKNTALPWSGGKMQSGARVYAALIDELHEHKSSDIHNLIQTATQAQEESLLIKTTTAGDTLQGVCYNQYMYSYDVLTGKIEDNPSFMAYICEADKDVDWRSDKALYQSNPNLGTTVLIDNIKIEQQKATDMPSYIASYQRFYLNQWVAGGEDAWMPQNLWDDCGNKDLKIADYKGKECYLGLDLSRNDDFSALSIYFPEDHALFPFFWLPREVIERGEIDWKLPYLTWEKLGYMKASGEATISINSLVNDIDTLVKSNELNVKAFIYDPAFSFGLEEQLEAIGIQSFAAYQTHKYFTPSITLFEKYIKEKLLKHPNNPIMNWMIGNTKLDESSAGLVKPEKLRNRSEIKIDGVVSSLFAIDGHLRFGEVLKQKETVHNYHELYAGFTGF